MPKRGGAFYGPSDDCTGCGASGVPLYEQLYREPCRRDADGGDSRPGTRMPGKRRLAAELSVSVNTVDAAYQMLAAEGYHGARGSAAAFMCRNIWPCPTRPEEVPPRRCQPLRRQAAEPPVRFDLSTRGVDPGLFPFRTWARLQKELLYSSPQLLTHGDAQGDVALRQALADYLEEYRGVRCTAAAGGGGCRYGVSAEPAGPVPARPNGGGKPRLPAREAGAGKQRRGVLLPACGCGRPFC